MLEEFLTLFEVLYQPRGLRKVVHSISGWLSPNITTLIQKFGLQKSIININKNTDQLILNIGCLRHSPQGTINTDIFPSIGMLLRSFRGKEKIEVDYYLNILYKDKNLIEKLMAFFFRMF